MFYCLQGSLSNANFTIVWATESPDSGLLDGDAVAAENTNLRCIQPDRLNYLYLYSFYIWDTLQPSHMTLLL